MELNLEKLKKKMYADSPYDIGSEKDDAYRDGVDSVLDAIEISCGVCGGVCGGTEAHG